MQNDINELLEEQFITLKKGQPAWDVPVIKDIGEFKDAVNSLLEDARREELKKFDEYMMDSALVDQWKRWWTTYYIKRLKILAELSNSQAERGGDED